MPVKQIARWVLLLGLLAVANTASAQEDATQNKSFFDRLDDFGKGIVGIFVPADKTKDAKDADIPVAKDNAQSFGRPAWGQSSDGLPESPRAGSILSGDTRTPPPPIAQTPSRGSLTQTSADTLPMMPAAGAMVVKPVRTQPADVLPFETPNLSETSKPGNSQVPSPAAGVPDSYTQPAEIVATPKPTIRPLHEQLLGLRQSPFSSGELHESGPQSDLPAGRAAGVSASSQSSPSGSSDVSTVAKRPSAAQGVGLAARGANDPLTGPSLGTSTAAPASPETQSNADNLLLFTRNGPVLAVETLGPRKIAVGKESTYEVSIVNTGEVAPDDLLVFVSLPDWAEVLATEATTGSAGGRGQQRRRHGAMADRTPERQGTRAARVADRRPAEQAVRLGRALGIQTHRLAGADRGARTKTGAAIGRSPRSPLRKEGIVPLEARQHGHRKRRERGHHAHAAGHRRERAGFAQVGRAARRRAEGSGRGTHRAAGRPSRHSSRGPCRGRRRTPN